MTKKTPATNALPGRVRAHLTTLGTNIALARKRRGLTQAQFAARMFTTPRTLYRLEKGDPGVGLDVLASALFVLGLESQLATLADAATDAVGQFEAKRQAPKRVRSRTDSKLDF
jgi:transcriptional regulator with XRE-family HTH domain